MENIIRSCSIYTMYSPNQHMHVGGGAGHLDFLKDLSMHSSSRLEFSKCCRRRGFSVWFVRVLLPVYRPMLQIVFASLVAGDELSIIPLDDIVLLM